MTLVSSALLVDTDICIDVSRRYAPTVARFEQAEQTRALAVSDITYMEILIGVQDKQQQAATVKFLRRFQIVPVDTAVSVRARELLLRYRLSHGLLLADSLIAATALVHGMPLLTKNTRDFRFIAGLTLETH